jgi:hypothetical protein
LCVKVRNNDPSILPELGNGKPFKIHHLSEKEDIELADALLENTSVMYLEFETCRCSPGKHQCHVTKIEDAREYEKLWEGNGQVRKEAAKDSGVPRKRKCIDAES